jgi:hypothetical protein
VTLTGTHLTGASLVVFGRDHALSWTVDSDTQITAVVPWDGATGPITVTTPAGTASSCSSFFMAPLFLTDPNCLVGAWNYGRVDEMTPNSGAPQDVIQLAGFNFTGATGVVFGGGAPATQFTVVNNSLITVTVPAGATSDAIDVVGPGGTARTNGAFTIVTPSAPSLSLAAPAAANPAATVTLTGSGLATVNRVTFNGVAATSFSMVNNTTLTAVVPFGAGTGPIVVGNPVGSASIAFTVLPPTLFSISSNGVTYPGTSINIYGNGFQDATSLTIGGVAVPVTILSDTVVSTVIPANLRPLAPVPVILVSPEGTSAPFPLNVYVPQPALTSFAPAAGTPGSMVTCTGQYFTHATAVSVGGVPVAAFQVVSDAQLTFVVPSAAVTGNVVILTAFGAGTCAAPFTVQPAAPPVQVAINQAPDNLLEGVTFSFTASVTGTAAATVTWSVAEGAAGGAISASGQYTAPPASGVYHITATSTADPTASATVAVPVHPANLAPGGGRPTVLDLAYFMGAMGSKAGDSNYNPLADLNGDGVIDDNDLALFLGAL